MADRRVTFLISANTKQFTKGIRKAQATFRKFSYKLDRAGKKLTRNFTAPIALIGGAALKSAAEFESLQQSMNVLNGSVKEGARNFERLKKFSAKTPFQLKDLASAQNMLQGFGLSADDAFKSLSQIGDIAAISGGEIKGIGIAFGQAAAEGRLMTRDVRQLINQGVPAIKLLAETMGVAKSDVLNLASEGKISFEILQQAFADATSEGGMFADGMAKQAKTLSGVWSTFKDNVNIALAELGESMSEAFDIKELAHKMIERIRSITDWFTSLSKSTQKSILKLVGVIGLGGPLLIALGAVSASVSSILGLFAALSGTAIPALITEFKILTTAIASNPIGAALTAIAVSFVLLKKDFDDVIERSKRLNTEIDKLASADTNSIGALEDKLSGLKSELAKVKESGRPLAWVPYLGADYDKIKRLKKLINETGKALKKVKPVGIFKSAAQTFNNLGIGQAMLGQTNQKPLIYRRKVKVKAQAESDPSKITQGFSGGIKKAQLATEGLNTSVGSLAGNFTKDLSKMRAKVGEFATIAQAAFTSTKDKSVELGQALQTVVNSSFQQLGETIANVFTGDAGAAGFFNGILQIAADFAAQLGKVIVGIGTASLALKTSFANPIAAIAAGTALIALSQVAKNLLKKGPQQKAVGMANGGVVPSGFPNDSYPAMLSSGETVIPSPKPIGGMGGTIQNHLYIDGREVELALEDRKYDRSR